MHIGDEMEISKEREAFEAEFSKIKSDIAFWLHTWDEEMQGYNHPVMCWFWYMWQAKKQATPEGFVLVRKELPEEIAESMALERVEKPVTETDPTWIKISEDAYKGRIQSKKWELWRDYKAMVEAQEKSHD